MIARESLTLRNGLIAVVALGAAYQLVDMGFISRWRDVQKRLKAKEQAVARLERASEELAELKTRWMTLASHTFPADQAVNLLDDLIKRLIEKHELEHSSIKASAPRTLPKTNITRVVTTVNADGTLNRVVRFLWDLYTGPLLLKMTSLRISPVERTGGGAVVRLDVQVETLVLPREPIVPRARPLDPAEAESVAPFRVPAFTLADCGEIARRNIFAGYEPAPRVVVQVRNDDRLPIRVTLEPSWKGKPREPKSFEVAAGGSAESPWVEGNSVKATARYEDGKTYVSPRVFEVTQRFVEGTQRFEWRVPAHSPPEPPKDVEVTIRNEAEAPVSVEVKVMVDGRMIDLAPLKVAGGATHKVDKMDTAQMILLAKYDGGGQFGPVTYTPASARPMTFAVPKREVAAAAPAAVDVPPPDPNLRVTGLLTFTGGQELIATHEQTKERRIFKLLETLDGGTLIFVHQFGGIVRMPGGQFYLYPYEGKFADRVLLEGATTEAQLPQALQAYREKRGLRT